MPGLIQIEYEKVKDEVSFTIIKTAKPQRGDKNIAQRRKPWEKNPLIILEP